MPLCFQPIFSQLLAKITDKNTIIDKIFKIDDKNYQNVGQFLHSFLEKYKKEFDRIIVNS